jgi:hypothetical protein
MLVFFGIILFFEKVPSHCLNAVKMQESAFRGASERYATLVETAAVLSKDKEAAIQVATEALEELAKAKSKAASAHNSLASLSTKLETTRDGLQGVFCQNQTVSVAFNVVCCLHS